jgi:hypothetical protein
MSRRLLVGVVVVVVASLVVVMVEQVVFVLLSRIRKLVKFVETPTPRDRVDVFEVLVTL